MIKSRRDHGYQPDTSPGGGSPAVLTVDLNKVLVVGRSQINRVVVSKIVEKSGLRPISEDPESALRTLQTIVPGTVVLDGGVDNRDCEALMAPLAALRRLSGTEAPCVILLSTRILSADDLSALTAIDAAVAKPITPELLQPVVDRLLDRLRG
jgi:CheY-like chemotaxis protein